MEIGYLYKKYQNIRRVNMEKMDINRDYHNNKRKLNKLRRKPYEDLDIEDKIFIFQLECKLHGDKVDTFYESKSEARRRKARRREHRRKK